MSLIGRPPEGARVRLFHVSGTVAADLLPIIKVHVSAASFVMTGKAGQYNQMGKHFAGHDYTTHSKGEYVRDGYIHTNTVEGYYSVFKREQNIVIASWPRERAVEKFNVGRR